MSDKGCINDVADCLKSQKKIYNLPRAQSEIRINNYNPFLLMANIDIQYLSESSLALAHYVSGYVTKSEKSSMHEIWDDIGADKSIYSRLWSFGIRSLCSRECGLYEHKKLVYLKEQNPDSKEIFEGSLIDTYYPERPTKLDSVCLYDFVQNYEKCGVNEDGVRKYRKLNKPCLPNHRLYDPNRENERDDYYYSLLLLFVPFRDEDSLVDEGESAEQAFNRVLHGNNELNVHHEKLQQMLKEQVTVKEINEVRLNDIEVVKSEDNGEGLHIRGEADAAMKDINDLQHTNYGGSICLEERVAMLNKDQVRVFHCVTDHLLHQKKHEVESCKCLDFKPLRMFLSGVGGTGKSFLIEAKVAGIWEEAKIDLTCAVAAPTGLAAFNIGGVTLHRLFQLPIEHDGKTATYWPLSKDAQKVMWTMLQHIKLIIVDEVSMLSSLNLTYMHLWLKGIGSVYKRHPVTKFEHGNHGASKRKFNHDRILVSDAATRIYVRKKILAPLMLQPVPSLLRTSLRHCQ